MKPTNAVSTAFHTESSVGKTVGGQSIFVSRVGGCGFWTVAGFCGCLFLSGWIGWCSTGIKTLSPLDTINPNSDPKESLVRLPGVGPARAEAIVEYRKSRSLKGPAFRTLADLDAVSGLGPKTVEKMKPWISFDNRQHLSGESVGNGRLGD